MLIAVSGNVGSGKTTLAKYLSDAYGFRFVPKRRLEFDFIDEFFHDIEGKFFPAQVSFLISKAIEIQEHLSYGRNIVVDRSLLEDIDVFARLWIENRQIDQKIIQLYHHTADFIKNAVPVPDLYIICRCPAETSLARIAQRPKRSFEKQYPPNHVQLLSQYYSELTIEAGVPCVEIDTTYYDFTKQSVLDGICVQIFEQLKQPSIYDQLSLFEDYPNEPQHFPGLVFHNFDGNHKITSFDRSTSHSEYIYLAAPFTQFATPQKRTIASASEEPNLLAALYKDEPYGTLPLPYRNRLRKIEKAIEAHCGMPVLLPHRDINNWGKTAYSSEYLTPKLVESVENASAFIAVPGCSIGVHLELGIAIAHKIPVIIFDSGDFPKSFFLDGFSELPNVKCIRAPSLSKIPALIESEKLSAFIKTARGETR